MHHNACVTSTPTQAHERTDVATVTVVVPVSRIVAPIRLWDDMPNISAFCVSDLWRLAASAQLLLEIVDLFGINCSYAAASYMIRGAFHVVPSLGAVPVLLVSIFQKIHNNSSKSASVAPHNCSSGSSGMSKILVPNKMNIATWWR